MEITFGDKVKINDEEVPEYLLKALYEHLKQRYAVPTSVKLCAGAITGGSIAVGVTHSDKFKIRYCDNHS